MFLSHFFNSQTQTIGIAAGILALSALISRILGLIREGLLASTFGATSQLDIYFAAFRIPDFVYNILISGGIVVAFLPLFSEYYLKNKEKAWEFTNNTLNVFLFFLISFCFILFIFTPFLLKFIAPGFEGEQRRQAITLTRLLFLSPVLFGLSSIFSGILQYFKRFLVYSLCPILYNLGIIFGIIFLAPFLGILGVVIGVIVGALFHFLIQVPSAVSCGFNYKAILNIKDPGLRKVFILMLPRTFGIAAQQINLIVITAIASTLNEGAITIFNFANNLQYFPVGIIGVSFAIAVFPNLSQDWVKREKETHMGIPQSFIKNFSSVFRQILYLIVPISALAFVLKNQIVRIILQHGMFEAESAKLTGAALGLFCFNIFALSLIPLIFRAFFAFQDTKTPTFIATFSMLLNIVLSFILSWLLNFENYFQTLVKNIFSLQNVENISVLGLVMAFAIATIFQFILLIIFLYKKIGDFQIKKIANSLAKIIIAVILMIGVCYFLLFLIEPILSSQTFFGVLGQAAVIGFAGILIYIGATFLMNSPELKELYSSILAQFS
ncbi:murein biosynthesis integral membrane protein MurJ [bacterium]|nr:murein biosynthesis integral membrane protein MurJ [bacterium]